ncbi:CLUMA_CG010813, isoform A [Clunio marinus]|uniref:poly(ADP-ribose) glycohydrolase n=1 Tax=Clunio marinus TaxID=568069 RepID=A0A1J1IB10_9DIPT|nr:CLUMA_CG010813, isoform A [Clunio marinus]
MALVMLPCELPWWSVVVRKITAIENTDDMEKILEIMQKIHDLCNISLDPDEDHMDSTVFNGLRQFINEMEDMERDKFLNHTIKIICRYAKNLKQYRPPRGMNFSLQQNIDSVEFDVKFVASLLANSFFSTYPKRTTKTHPTLKDFNFTHFFKELNTNSQKAKFRSFLWYFEWLEAQQQDELDRKIKLSRKSIQFITHPELLIILLFVENLEDNETILAENVVQVSRIVDPKNKAILEKLIKPKKKSSMICMDAESYETFPPSQYEEDNCLRELNKCLLAFRQNTCAPMSSKLLRILSNQSHSSRDHRGRLSPIGESFTLSGKSSIDCATKIHIEPVSPTTSTPTTFGSQLNLEETNKRRSWLNLPENKSRSQNSIENDKQTNEEKRRGRFIVLGSSGECLPVNREFSTKTQSKSASFFANGDGESDDDEVFYSARNSLNEEEEDSDDSRDDFFDHQRYSIELETPENRSRFAQQLKDALKLENGYTESTEDCSMNEDDFSDNYAVDINVEGSRMHDKKIKIRRGNSTGFILEDDDSLDDCRILPRMDMKRSKIKRNKTGDSSKYSFDTEASELEEIYDQLAKWLNDPLDNKERKLDERDKAVLKFADSLLKRALSESFIGEVIDDSTLDSIHDDDTNLSVQQKRKMVSNFRSLSLEVAKHKNLLSSQLNQHNSPEKFRKFVEQKAMERERKVKTMRRKWSITTMMMEENIKCDVTLKLSQKNFHLNANLRSIATGSWGCGSQQSGDPQFKVVIQWLAASVANVPTLIYYTCAKESLSKLDTVVRVLHDRKWTVGELLRHTLFYAKDILNNPTNINDKNFCLFDKLIGLEKSN